MYLPPGLADILRAFRNPGLIFYMAWSEIRARYKRSMLGPLWITLGTAVGTIGMGYIGSELFKIDRADYLPLLTIGLILWQFIAGCINESSTVFIRGASIIRNLDLPIAMHPAQLVLRHIINFAHNLPLYVLIALIFKPNFNLYTFYIVPNFLLVALNLYWISLLIGTFGARFRDLEYMIGMIMPIMMFLSPVMYRPKSLPFSGNYIWLNPLADLIEIIRYPLLGEATPTFLYVINIGMLAIGGSLTILLYNTKRNRIAFWV